MRKPRGLHPDFSELQFAIEIRGPTSRTRTQLLKFDAIGTHDDRAGGDADRSRARREIRSSHCAVRRSPGTSPGGSEGFSGWSPRRRGRRPRRPCSACEPVALMNVKLIEKLHRRRTQFCEIEIPLHREPDREPRRAFCSDQSSLRCRGVRSCRRSRCPAATTESASRKDDLHARAGNIGQLRSGRGGETQFSEASR